MSASADCHSPPCVCSSSSSESKHKDCGDSVTAYNSSSSLVLSLTQTSSNRVRLSTTNQHSAAVYNLHYAYTQLYDLKLHNKRLLTLQQVRYAAV
eukprot:15176-Heterococcus_DN1.PRE.1